MTERERLIKFIKPKCVNDTVGLELVDWILADRKRIVEPLVKIKNGRSTIEKFPLKMIRAIDETLKLAGETND